MAKPAITKSRFAILDDDASDPYEIGKKKPKAKPEGNGSGDNKSKSATKNKKKKAKSPNTVEDKQTLQDMAFGGNNSNPVLPPGISKANKKVKNVEQQFVTWKDRDTEIVEKNYDSELAQALLQSKLDFEEEQRRVKQQATTGKSKKKAAPIPLADFNASVIQGSSLNNLGSTNGDGNADYFTDYNSYSSSKEALANIQLQIKQEKQFELERNMIQNRNSKFLNKTPVEIFDYEETKAELLERDTRIGLLEEENENLKKENETLKKRFIVLKDLLNQSETKSKAQLANEVTQLRKVNNDLNDDIANLHQLLEQEKSKSHTALIEYRKLIDQQKRKRTNTESSQ